MASVTDALLKEIAGKIVAVVHPRMIILFGSHARGTARSDSDLDFIVVEDGHLVPNEAVDSSRLCNLASLDPSFPTN